MGEVQLDDSPRSVPTLRRSDRATAGKHSNPHHLPSSVIHQVKVPPGADGPVFQDFDNALSSLGATLSQSLGQILGQVWTSAQSSPS